jgi:hypothetical protein
VLALRPCGFSIFPFAWDLAVWIPPRRERYNSDLIGCASKTNLCWKCRKAGKRALRYILNLLPN